jgi:RNA-directed DNA polymerase
MKTNRNTIATIATLKRKLQGCWNYYGVIGNSEQTWNYAWFAKRLVYKWLNRRSQRKNFTVRSFVAAWERWQMPDPQVNETPWPRTARQHQPRPV